MEALWSRYLPIYQQVRQWLDVGAIGEVVSLHSTFGFQPPFDPASRVWSPGLAGGALLDIGVYNIAISQWVLNQDPDEFTVAANISGTGVDELDAVNLLYSNDVVSQFICSLRTELPNDFHISGTKGSIRIHGPFWNTESATLSKADISDSAKAPFLKNGFEYQVMEAQRCIKAGLLESPGMTHAASLANMELMDAIRDKIGIRYPFE
jgi:predicted dehydrogenase